MEWAWELVCRKAAGLGDRRLVPAGVAAERMAARRRMRRGRLLRLRKMGRRELAAGSLGLDRTTGLPAAVAEQRALAAPARE